MKKYIYLLIVATILTACSKEELIGPLKLKNGEEVQVSVSDRYGTTDEQVRLLPSNQPAEMPLLGFVAREPGYNYQVKAKVVKPAEPPQDGSAYWLEFISVLKKEKTNINAPFTLALLQSFVPGGPIIRLRKEADKYYFDDRLMLTYANEEVRQQLEEIWTFNKSIYESWQNNKTVPPMKWKGIKAIVTHDPELFGKAYRISKIEFTE
jgi:hypothetical protein